MEDCDIIVNNNNKDKDKINKILELVSQVEHILLHDRDSLSTADVAAYFEALSWHPDRVRQETPILDFLRTEDFDPLRAAKRLALYWKVRKQVFAQDDRWLRRMDQSGAGILTPEQVDILRTGFLSVVDSPTLGKIAIIDNSLLPAGVADFQPQVSMYFMAAIGCKEIQTNGITVLVAVHSRGRAVCQPQPLLAQQIMAASPLRVKRVVVAQAFEYGKEYLMDYLGFKHERLSQAQLQQSPAPLIKANSIAETLALLQQEGFDRETLPREFGGSLDTHGNFHSWLRTRVSIEEIMGRSFSPFLVRQGELANAFHTAAISGPAVTANNRQIVAAASRQKDNTTGVASVVPKTTKKTTPATRLVAKKTRPSYARRQNNVITQLQRQLEQLQDQNRHLRKETQRYQHLLTQARLLVAMTLQTNNLVES